MLDSEHLKRDKLRLLTSITKEKTDGQNAWLEVAFAVCNALNVCSVLSYVQPASVILYVDVLLTLIK